MDRNDSSVEKIRVAIIEDDEELSELLSLYLHKFNFSTTQFSDPRSVIDSLKESNFNLIILDLSLPFIDGIDLLKEIRKFSEIPVIISSARGSVDDKVNGLSLGADDYIPKPYEPIELVARVKAVLKRVEKSEPKNSDFTIDISKRVILKEGKSIELTKAEFDVLKLLLENRGQIFSRDMISDAVTSIQWDSVDRTIDVLISRIRQKIGDNSRNPKYIKSVRGVGYQFL